MADLSRWKPPGLDTTYDFKDAQARLDLANKLSNTPTFTEASERVNIASGEDFPTILGKIKKFFTDLKTVAFTGSYSDLSSTPTLGTAAAKDMDSTLSNSSNNPLANSAIYAAVESVKTVKVTTASFSTLPQTVSNANITASHEVVNSVLSNPSAQTGDWSVSTSNGSLTVSGSISGSTTLTLYLDVIK